MRIMLTSVMLTTIISATVIAHDGTAKGILQEAIERQQSRTFSATSQSGSGESAIAGTIMQRQNPDGSVFVHHEFRTATGITSHITNQDGKYTLYDRNKVVKQSYQTPRPKFSEGATYRPLKEVSQHGKSCYVITQEIPMTDSAFRQYLAMVPAEMQKKLGQEQLRRIFRSSFITTKVYHVGQDDLFIYATAFYTGDGKLKQEIIWEQVDLNPKLPDTLFALPPGTAITIANSLSDDIEKSGIIIQQKALMHTKSHKESGWRQRLETIWNHHEATMIRVAVVVLQILAGGIILFVIIYKIRELQKR